MQHPVVRRGELAGLWIAVGRGRGRGGGLTLQGEVKGNVFVHGGGRGGGEEVGRGGGGRGGEEVGRGGGGGAKMGGRGGGKEV